MQIKVFTIPIHSGDNDLDVMNRFLRGNKILEINEAFYTTGSAAFWCYSVHYLEKLQGPELGAGRKKVDYKSNLNESAFEMFSLLRKCRKLIATEDAIPAFAVFTDAELADMTALPELTIETMKTIKGIGEKKTEK